MQNCMQKQVDGVFHNKNNNIIIISSASFDDVLQFGELFTSNSDQELKEVSLDEFNVAIPSIAIVGPVIDEGGNQLFLIIISSWS